MATDAQRKRFADMMSQGADEAAAARETIAAKVANFKPLGALSGSRYHESTERGGKRRRRRRKSRRKSRKSRRKRRKSRRKRKKSRRRRRRRH